MEAGVAQLELGRGGVINEAFLIAISLGAVFMVRGGFAGAAGASWRPGATDRCG